MNYMGSKRRIAKYIVPIMQKIINDNNIPLYLEPMVGGGNIIDKIVCERKIGNDISVYLIALLNHVKEGKPLLESVSKELYYDIKANMDKYEPWIVGNAGYLSSYNGRFFDGGYAGDFVDRRRKLLRNKYQECLCNILKQAQSLLFKQTEFVSSDYIQFLKDMNPNGALIYFDPPYINSQKYYMAKEFDVEEFWDVVRMYSKNNFCIVSEQVAPDDFECIWFTETQSTMDLKSRPVISEKLFIWKDGILCAQRKKRLG